MPPARLWPYLLLYALVALALTFSGLHHLQTGDSLIFTLAGLYEWRPFFWEQDRVGLVWSLLAAWCPHPLAALLLVTFVTTFLGLCLPLVFARLLTPHPAGPVVATLASAVVLLFAPTVVVDNWLLACNYPGALVLGFTALLLLGRPGGWRGFAGRAVVAGGLLFVATWAYAGVLLPVALLGVVRGWRRKTKPTRSWWGVAFRPFTRREVWAVLIGSAVAAGAVYAMMDHAVKTEPGVRRTAMSFVGPELWGEIDWRLRNGLFNEPGMQLIGWTLASATAGGLAVGLLKRPRLVVTAAAWVLPAEIAAGVEYALLCTSGWVLANDCHPRYLVAVGTGLALAGLLLGLVPTLDLLPRRWLRAVGAAAGVGLLSAAVVRFGLPAPDVPRRILDEKFGEYTADLLAAEVDGVGGDFWAAWPAVWHTNLTLYERGERRVLWGVTQRSGPWEQRWQTPGRTFRVGVPAGREGWPAMPVPEWPYEATDRGLVIVGEREQVGRVRVFEVRWEPAK